MENENGGEVLDLYFEHTMHHKYTEHCSECFKQYKEVDRTNAKQENNLAKLRESIKAQRELREKEFEPVGETTKPKMELIPVPEITITDIVEFQYDRHSQICERVNALYHNYLVNRFAIDVNESNTLLDFENGLQDLARGIDELIDESGKIRWS